MDCSFFFQPSCKTLSVISDTASSKKLAICSFLATMFDAFSLRRAKDMKLFTRVMIVFLCAMLGTNIFWEPVIITVSLILLSVLLILDDYLFECSLCDQKYGICAQCSVDGHLECRCLYR